MPERGSAWFFKAVIGVLLFAALHACEEDPAEARFKLGELGYPFNAFSLLVATESNDHVALTYLILAGMDPNTAIDWSVIREERQRTGTGRELAFMMMWGLRADHDWHVQALHVAAGQGHTESVEVLLDAGADLDAIDSAGNTALMRATEGGHADVVEMLLDVDAEQVANEDGDTPLARAVEHEDIVLLEILLDAGGDVTVINNVGLSVLAQATTVEVAQILIDAGADVNVQFVEGDTGDGLTPLMTAVRASALDVVRILLDAGADPNLRSRKGETALMMAARKDPPTEDTIAIVEALIEAGADPNVLNERSEAALHIAFDRTRESHTENELAIVRALLGAGADPNALDNRGTPPLILVILKRLKVGYTVEVLEVLLAAGAKPDLQDAQGDTALMSVIRTLYSYRGGTDAEALALPVLDVLLEAGANPETVGENGESALTLAIAKNWMEALKAMVDAGADPNSPRGDGVTALMLAAGGGKADTVRQLLDMGADPNLRSNNGDTALMWAASRGLGNAIAALFGADADPNVQNNAGATALTMALGVRSINRDRTKGPALIKSLLDAGGDPNIVPEGDQTPLMAAADTYVEFVKLLLDAGADPEAKTEDGRTAMDVAESNRIDGQRVRAALVQAIARKRASEAASEAQPVGASSAPAKPSPGPTHPPESPPSVVLGNEKYIGGSKSRGMKMYALSSDGNWCAEAVVFKFVAASATVYSDGTVNFFMKRFGERINEAQFCPAARSARLYGYTEAGRDPVFTGTASAAGGWSVN